VSALPGVQAAGAASVLPASDHRWNRGVQVEGRPAPARATDQTIEYQAATPGYFEVMGMALRLGRDFAATDDAGAAAVAVINEAAVRVYWPDTDPIGRRIGFGSPLGGFAVAALLRATLGVYGVVATAEQARTRELGIRLALGAQRADVFRLVLGGGVMLVVPGTALGSAGAFWVARGIRGLLTAVEPGDPAVFAATGLLLAAAAMVASWLPARRAARTDPVMALRAE
jgi:ABC-type antimicrobial peptide transport system permease subunit